MPSGLDIPDLDRHLHELEERSSTVIPDYLDRDTTAAIRAHVDALVDADLPAVDSAWTDTDKPRIIVNEERGIRQLRHPIPGEIMPADVRSLRSYGSMTYAGYKSLLFAGLPHDDPRVLAALAWIRAHWTLDENPGLGDQGYYYYLHGLARAMRAGGHAVLTDAAGTPHRWRQELVDALTARQHADGHWTNEETRWLEGHSELATIYAVLALQEALKPPPPAAS